MQITRLPLDHVGKLDLVPRVVVERSVAQFRAALGIGFDRDQDDLDSSHVAYFRGGNTVFAFIHHDGEPPDSITVYMDRSMTAKAVDKLLSHIQKEFGISSDLISWKESVEMYGA